MVNVLYIGDVSGQPGREIVAKVLPDLRKKYSVDLVVAQIENLAHGKGATVKTVQEMMGYGVDFMTGGNHIWRRKDFEELLSGEFPVIRTLNYPEDIIGKGYEIVDLGKKGRILIALLQGRAFMQDPVTTDIFRPIDKLLDEVKNDDLAGIIVEVHAETTSEKIATGFYLDGRVSAVLGTHTHVPTADERILPKGSGYITDIGMAGPYDSVLWVQPEIVQHQMKYPYAPPYDVQEDGKSRFDAVLLKIDGPGSCREIERVHKVL